LLLKPAHVAAQLDHSHRQYTDTLDSSLLADDAERWRLTTTRSTAAAGIPAVFCTMILTFSCSSKTLSLPTTAAPPWSWVSSPALNQYTERAAVVVPAFASEAFDTPVQPVVSSDQTDSVRFFARTPSLAWTRSTRGEANET